MVRAVLSIAGIVATIAVLIWCFGITVPQVTSTLPAVNRSVAHTVALMQGSATENGREPADEGGGSAPAPGGAAPDTANPSPASVTPRNTVPAPSAAVSAPNRTDQPEIISPDSTAHLNPE